MRGQRAGCAYDELQETCLAMRFFATRLAPWSFHMRRFLFAFFVLIAALLGRGPDAGAKDKKEPDKKEPDKKEPAKVEPKDGKDPYLLVIPPTGAKEVKLADWRFTHGTRRLALGKDAPAKGKGGPEYLEFREEKSTTYQNGIVTLVPLASIRKIDYDREKKTVAVIVATSGETKEETLTGTTRFIGLNKITLEADALLEGLGAATVKFQGGADEGLRRITFPAPKPVAEAKGMVANIIAIDKERTKHTVYDLQPLYLIDGSYRVLPHLMFKKTVKVDMDKLVSLRFIPPSDKKASYDFEVALKDGDKHTLTLLTKIELDKKKTATFEGLIGRVPAGYKLFPAHTIQELLVGEPKKELDAE
jgi:hypothetical protein